jgi:hypothetical protein
VRISRSSSTTRMWSWTVMAGPGSFIPRDGAGVWGEK